MSDILEDNRVMEKLCRSNTTSPVNFASRSETSSGYFSSSPSTPTSPVSISPPHTLKRSRSSSFRLINRRVSTISNSSQISIVEEPSCKSALVSLIGWYPVFLVRIVFELFSLFVFVLVKRLPFVIPTLWATACLWILWKSVMLPLSILKSFLIFIFVPAEERYRKKRTVLISGGGTIQTVQLARNFYSAGARVVVCEVEGNFGLARFSTAVHKYYTVPKPNNDSINEYIETLKTIVIKEKVKYYIPVSESSSAYYDAVAKPHIELLKCECICPDLKDVLLLDDTFELMRKVQCEGIVTPNYYQIHNLANLNKLYDFGTVKQEPHFMVNVGLSGCKQRQKIKLPSTRRKLRLSSAINEQNPWVLVQDCEGERFVTCTTVRSSQVVANVTCKVDNFGGLIPVPHTDIEQWVKNFFAKLKYHKNIVGHMSFYFTVTIENEILVTGCEVGVRLPYICYTSVQSRVVWKPCKHFSRHKSGPIVTSGGKYWLNEIVLNTLEYPSSETIWKFLEVIFGRHEVLFTVWDPLPYCAYYYLQLPLNSISNVIKINSL